MTRPIDAIVTGFTRNAQLGTHAFAPLLELRQQSVIRNIHYVTWDSAGIDEFVAPIAALGGIGIARVPQPEASGNPNQRGIVYQTVNLAAALARVKDDALVVKLRPDFIFRTPFLESKLRDFHRFSATAGNSAWGVKLPRVPLSRKIWIPWADANQPFFYEDAAFIGLRDDLAKLVTPDVESKTALLGDMECGSLVHVLRYAGAFLPRYPIFKRYIENYGAFAKDIAYRRGLVGMLLQDGFFWHLLVAHAWILHAGFHVDCGQPGDLSFYPNTVNTQWDDFATLKLTPPYDRVDRWREGANAGTEIVPALMRIYGRLMDDAWPQALFTGRVSDMPDGMLARVAHGLSLYSTGCLSEIEDAFYAKLDAYRRQHRPAQQAA